MMKRMLLLLAALLLLCLPAQAEEDLYNKIENALYRIVLRTEEGDVSLGSGALFMDQQVLLTVESCCPEGSLYAIGMDGEHAISGAEKLGDTGVVLLEMATASAYEPLDLAAEDSAGLAALFGVDAKGENGVAPLYQVRQGMYRDQQALLLSSAEGMLPGCFMTDEYARLIGIVVAQQAEGVGAYTALDANVLYRAFTRIQYADAFLPVEASWQGGNLTISWQDEERDHGLYMITASGMENNYYIYFQTAYDNDSIQLQLPPGHGYYLQVQWAEAQDQMLEPVWAAMDEFTVPAGVFSGYQYQQECVMATKPAGNTSAEAAVLETPTTRALTDPALSYYLKVTASYDVSDKIELPMAVELIAPDGQFYFESAVCTLAPAREKKDIFLLPLDDLLADCVEFSGGELKPGSYLLRYALAGKTAGEYAFTLSAEEAAPQTTPAAESGFATGLSIEQNAGLVTVSWDGASIPQDAAVDVFFLYDGNAYYSYRRMNPGVNSTEVFTVPGRDMMIWVYWSVVKGDEPLMPQTEEEYVVVHVGPETPHTANGFTNLRIGVTVSADPDAATSTEFLPAVPLTKEVLTNPETPLYFQTEDAYQVTETSAEHPLVIALFTPEGLVFVAEASYIFDVTLQESDLWVMDISSLCRDYESLICGAWPAGEYRILYCIDGQVAGEYTFTLE